MITRISCIGADASKTKSTPSLLLQTLFSQGFKHSPCQKPLVSSVSFLKYYTNTGLAFGSPERDFKTSYRFAASNYKGKLGFIRRNFTKNVLCEKRVRKIEIVDFPFRTREVWVEESDENFFKRRPKTTIFIALILGAFAAAYMMKEYGEGPAIVISTIRMLRAFKTLGLIIFDYKWNLRDIDSEKNPELYKKTQRDVHQRCAERLLDLCLKNGCLYIKAGQHIASLNQILPPEYTVTMQPVLDRAKPRPFEEIKEFIQSELGMPIEAVFKSINKEPIAAASLAQVYEAVLHNGDKVAVKVQYPYLESTCEGDVTVFDAMISTAEWFFPDLRLKWLAEEFKINLPNELDFKKEGKNCERLGHNMKQYFSNVRTPKVYWDFTSSRIITLEFIDGVKVNNKKGLEAISADPAAVSQLLTEVFSVQIFLQGFIHCDPHAGNILVRRKDSFWSSGLELVVLDHGLYQTISDDFRADYARLWKCVIERDQEGVREMGQKLGVKEYKLFATMLTCREWKDNDVGINEELTQDEYERLLQYGQQNFFNITNVLSGVNRQVLLLLKANDLLRSLQVELGLPINFFTTFAKYAMYGLTNYEVKANPSLWNIARSYWRYVTFSWKLALIALYLAVQSWFQAARSIEIVGDTNQGNRNILQQRRR